MREYEEENYRTVFGIEKQTFCVMLDILTNEYESIHKKGAEKMGRHRRKDLRSLLNT